MDVRACVHVYARECVCECLPMCVCESLCESVCANVCACAWMRVIVRACV